MPVEVAAAITASTVQNKEPLSDADADLYHFLSSFDVEKKLFDGQTDPLNVTVFRIQSGQIPLQVCGDRVD